MGELNLNLTDKDREQMRSNQNLLLLCKQYWDGLYAMRQTARNNRKMLQGYQWTRDEIEKINRQGQRPITHNIISQIMANLNGQYLASKGQPVAIARKRDCATEGKMMSLAIEHVVKVNDEDVQDAKQFSRLAISGVICSRVDFGYLSEKDRSDVIITNVNPHTLFFNPSIDDGKTDNINLIGTINEDSLDGMIVNFAKDEQDAEVIKKIYNWDDKGQDKYLRQMYSFTRDQNSEHIDNIDFLESAGEGLCRYYEVWTKERRLVVRYHDTANGESGTSDLSLKEIEQINKERVAQAEEEGVLLGDVPLIHARQRYEYRWVYRYITPTGYILQQGESPFAHQSHPYVLAFYDVMDGNIQPVISNITELQREINHLYMQADFMNGNGAKGALFFDKKIFASSGISPEDVQRGWSAFNTAFGVDVPQGKSLDGLIRQFYTSGNVAPILNMYQNNVMMAQQIIGVNPAIQGQAPSSGTPTSRYLMESQNAQLNSKPFIETMAKFKERKYNKVLKLIQQYYDEPMFEEVAGKENLAYNPDIKDIDFDLSLTQEITAGNYSITEDDKLFALVQQGALPFDMYCELSHSGFAKQALELIKQRQQQMQEAQQAQAQQGEQQLTPEQIQQLRALQNLQSSQGESQTSQAPKLSQDESQTSQSSEAFANQTPATNQESGQLTPEEEQALAEYLRGQGGEQEPTEETEETEDEQTPQVPQLSQDENQTSLKNQFLKDLQR